MSVALNAGIREAVEGLVRANIEAEPAVVKAYLFPSDREISLVYVDPTTSPLRADEGAVLILRPQGRVFTPLRSYEGQLLRGRRLAPQTCRSRRGAHGPALTAWRSE